MPQLDKLSYSTQIFWLLILFTSFYFFILKHVLPKLLLNIKVRGTKMLNISLGNANSSAEALGANQAFVQANEKIINVLNTSIEDTKCLLKDSWTHANIAISHSQHVEKDTLSNKDVIFSKLLTSKIISNE